MAASKATVKEVVKVILDKIDMDEALDLMNHLGLVKGNKSFTETIRLIREEIYNVKLFGG